MALRIMIKMPLMDQTISVNMPQSKETKCLLWTQQEDETDELMTKQLVCTRRNPRKPNDYYESNMKSYFAMTNKYLN